MIVCIKNILQNAFKYADTDQGVDVFVDQGKEGFTVSVQDYGPGIKENDKKHVFESFYRSKGTSSISGFGLGLSISKKIITAHNGSISVSSDKNKGTKFVLFLPIGGNL